MNISNNPVEVEKKNRGNDCGLYLPIVSNVDSVRSYVGITMSNVSAEPHQDRMGIGFVLCLTRGQSPRLTKNSISGRTTCRKLLTYVSSTNSKYVEFWCDVTETKRVRMQN